MGTKNFENKVRKTIEKFNLISKKDKALVAVSGGKDSTTALYIVHKLFPRTEAITIDALIGNYSKKNLENIKRFCKEHGIKLHVISFRDEFGYSLCYIQSILKSKKIKLNSCAICGVLKRYLLNRYAKKLKMTKLVTGHNLDDESQNILMNFLRFNLELFSRLGPKTGLIKHKTFVQRVKPLYFCSEREIIEYSKKMKFPVLYDRCPCSEYAYRRFIENLLDEYEKKHKNVKMKIIDGFLKILPKVKDYYRTAEKIKVCRYCGEPSKKDTCMACNIIGIVKFK